MGRVKSRFVRALIETVQQETGGAASSRLRSGLPPHLLRVLTRDVLGATERDATLDLDGAMEVLLAVDRVLCGGSGIVMARACAALASRVLSQSTGLVVAGDTVATLQHLRAPFEHPFVDVEVRYSARRNALGFVFELELVGHPRAVHWLCAAGLGYARASAKFSGQGSGPLLRFETREEGDLARIFARSTETGPIALPLNRPTSLASQQPLHQPPRRRSSPTNAAARVDEILGRGASGSTPRAPTARREHASAAAPDKPRPGSGLRPNVSGGAPGARKNAS